MSFGYLLGPKKSSSMIPTSLPSHILFNLGRDKKTPSRYMNPAIFDVVKRFYKIALWTKKVDV